jgi:AraC family transcriptional regulator
MNPLYPKIIILEPKKYVGINKVMTLYEDKTFQLWNSFMPLKKSIKNSLNNNLISLQVYDSTPSVISIDTPFTKWALVEVDNFFDIPEKMECFELEGGMYAVFNYKGLSTDKSIFVDIYTNWLPNSIYALENKPHFQVMGEKYKNNDPNSEEEIWIPIKVRNL